MFLLDTDTLSELIKRRANPQLISRLSLHPPESMATASICVMELRSGAARRGDGATLWNQIEREILSRVRILAFGDEEARVAGDILADLYRKGTPIGLEDVMIGAIALRYGGVVITGNVRHFSQIPRLRVENWVR